MFGLNWVPVGSIWALITNALAGDREMWGSLRGENAGMLSGNGALVTVPPSRARMCCVTGPMPDANSCTDCCGLYCTTSYACDDTACGMVPCAPVDGAVGDPP